MRRNMSKIPHELILGGEEGKEEEEKKERESRIFNLSFMMK
jgi:hypothetical protein